MLRIRRWTLYRFPYNCACAGNKGGRHATIMLRHVGQCVNDKLSLSLSRSITPCVIPRVSLSPSFSRAHALMLSATSFPRSFFFLIFLILARPLTFYYESRYNYCRIIGYYVAPRRDDPSSSETRFKWPLRCDWSLLHTAINLLQSSPRRQCMLKKEKPWLTTRRKAASAFAGVRTRWRARVRSYPGSSGLFMLP